MRIHWIILLSLVLTACGARTVAPADPFDTGATNAYATALAAPATSNPIGTKVPTPNSGAATIVPSAEATQSVATPIGSSTSTITATSKPKPRPTATAASTSPLTFTGTGIYVASCRLAPTTDKPSHLVVQVSIELTGGNGVYEYFDNNGQQWPTKFMAIEGDRGTAMIGKVVVTSGDGQTLSKEYYIQPGDLACS